MDDRRFDSFARSLASGASRRSVLKGLLGLGGAAATGGMLRSDAAEAARRPTPTPKPVTCPGRQTWNGSQCVCPGNAPYKCGPDCCTGDANDPPSPTHSECCDNACCFGTCYGEELCCATNPGSGEQPPANRVCTSANGVECCPSEEACCGVDGCCDTVCWGGNEDNAFCCPAEAYCPGNDSPDRCCTNDFVCCGASTSGNLCRDPNVVGGCCATADCPAGQVCEDNLCVTPCVTEVQVPVHLHDGGASDICPDEFSNLATEVGLYPYDDSNGCGDTAIATANSTADGPAIFPNVPSGLYCPLPTDPAIRNCIDCPSFGQGIFIDVTAEPCETMTSVTIGASRCCVVGEKVAVLVHAPSGCSQGTSLSGVPVELSDCDSGEVLYGPVSTNDDGYADFEAVPLGTYCVGLPANSPYISCLSCQDNPLYRSRIEVTCGQTTYPLIGICQQGQHCDDGACVDDAPCDGRCTELEVCVDFGCYCRPGTYDDFEGSCILCGPGTYSDDRGAFECTNCDLNFYQDQSGQSGCLPCAEGFYTEHVGASVCIACNCELGNMPLICGCGPTPCDAGYQPDGFGMCVLCPTGSASFDGSACVPCAAGSFAGCEGQATCDPCPFGRYADGIGASICTLCPAGSYQDALGQIGCQECGYLTYTPAEGSTSCQACDCTLDCDPRDGDCLQVGPESPCSENADCDTNVCGCGAGPMFPDCICRYANCRPTGSACTYHLNCCSGDCVGDFCIAVG